MDGRRRIEAHPPQTAHDAKETVELFSGGGHNAFSRYERGEITPPKPLMLLMRLLDRPPHLLDDAKVLAEGADLRGAFTHTINTDHEALKASWTLKK